MLKSDVYTVMELLVVTAKMLNEEVVTQANGTAIIVSPGDDPLTVYRNWRNGPTTTGGKTA